MNALLKPIITEKATRDSELMNCYTFEVIKSANKVEIKKEVESKSLLCTEVFRIERSDRDKKISPVINVLKFMILPFLI